MAEIDPTVEMVRPCDLEFHPDNPRRGDVAAIKRSIQRNGWYGTVVAQRSTRRILAKNHSVRAAIELGIERVPVFWFDCDDAAAKRILAGDNRLSDLAGYDSLLLAELLTAIVDDGGGLDGTGYSDDDLGALLESTGRFDVSEADTPSLPIGDRSPLRQVTFTLHDEQWEEVEAAIGKAKKAGGGVSAVNENSNGNALAWICERFNRG